jgi:peptide deformylase
MIITIPDKLALTDKVLHIPGKPVLFDNTKQNDYLAHKMLDFMLTCDGVGLAAPQIGISRRLFVMQVDRISHFIFNPVITYYSDAKIIGNEGCLSYPGEFITVPRSKNIAGTYQNYRGETVEFEINGGLLSVCFQHEYDHLDGIVMHDRATV